MGFFKKRTTKTIGKDIGRSIGRQKTLEKNLRTLQKEKEERDKETKLKEQIRKIKSEKPSLTKKFMKVAKAIQKRRITTRIKKRKTRKVNIVPRKPMTLNQAMYGGRL